MAKIAGYRILQIIIIIMVKYAKKQTNTLDKMNDIINKKKNNDLKKIFQFRWIQK